MKDTDHKSSEEIDVNTMFVDYRECYTCKHAFEGFYKLMEHRKSDHPSNRKWKNFPDNCIFGSKCSYIHENNSDALKELSSPSLKCTIHDIKVS